MILVVATAAGGVVALSSGDPATSAAQVPRTNTAKVEKGTLSAMVSLDGTLTYRAGADGSSYAVMNRASGTYTELPDVGAKVACGDVLYRVDDRPVLLLCGTVPAYRDLRAGDRGRDVRQLNQNLHALGYDKATGVDFTTETRQGLVKLQRAQGLDETGELAADEAVFLPDSVRIAKVTATLGGSARPGAPIAQGTSDTLEVRVALDASQQGEVKKGNRARITLPGNTSVTGNVNRLGRVAQTTRPDQDASAATIAAYLSLDHQDQARGLDRAPVQVEITTTGVSGALSVPVTAIVGKSGGGFAVEVVRAGGHRGLVAVRLGLFDTSAGRVQVAGDLHPGDDVAVPSL